MSNRKKLLLPLLVLTAVAAALAHHFYFKSRPGEVDVVRVSGNIEVTQVQLSFRIPGWLEARLVDEGDRVKISQPVAQLDHRELDQQVTAAGAESEAAAAVLAQLLAGARPQELYAAAAAYDQAAARLRQLTAGSRPEEIAVAQAAVDSARAEVGALKLANERAKSLYESKVLSKEEYDRAKASYDMAAAKLNQAEQQLTLAKKGPRQEEIDQASQAARQAEANLSLVREGPRKEEIAQARARLDQVRQSLEQARTRRSYAEIPSPIAGVVLSKNAEPGEFVAAGTPVVTVGDLVNVWMRGYIPETELGRVKVGQLARVTADTWPGKVYEGRISFISPEAEFTPKNVQTEKQRVKLVYRIKIDITNPAMELKPGMPADTTILTGQAPEGQHGARPK